MRGYPVARVRQEVAFLGRHVHWTLAELLTLDHSERMEWIREIVAAGEGEDGP
ncbi:MULTISPECIES: DUF6760 family protein [Streptomyces]|uniref:DUF6760 family protein n=1 Tax=Streptomyces TaxID=1883 RepID=UPI000B2B22D2|nr:DUF6760 family protein [Streptomyces sp. CB02120-2]RPK33035.1 hypothetical protein EES37_31975 [Streptomyces sp. ADI91-18]